MYYHARAERREVSVSEISKIISMTKEGVSRYEIARTLGRSISTIWSYQKKFLN